MQVNFQVILPSPFPTQAESSIGAEKNSFWKAEKNQRLRPGEITTVTDNKIIWPFPQVMGMFGIIMMVIENELSSAGVYNKVWSKNIGVWFQAHDIFAGGHNVNWP